MNWRNIFRQSAQPCPAAPEDIPPPPRGAIIRIEGENQHKGKLALVHYAPDDNHYTYGHTMIMAYILRDENAPRVNGPGMSEVESRMDSIAVRHYSVIEGEGRSLKKAYERLLDLSENPPAALTCPSLPLPPALSCAV